MNHLSDLCLREQVNRLSELCLREQVNRLSELFLREQANHLSDLYTCHGYDFVTLVCHISLCETESE